MVPLAEMDDIEIEALIGEEGGSLAGVFGPLPNVAAEVDASASQSCVAPDDDDASAPHLHRGNGDEGPSAASSAQPPSVHDVGGDEDAHVDRGLRGKGEVSAFFPHGKITYYAKDSRFEAVCRFCQSDGDKQMCRLTRTGRRNERRPNQGRPLGLMSAWLLAAPKFVDKESHIRSHCDRLWLSTSLTRAQRRAGRKFLRSLAHGPALLSKEGELRPGEESEPEGI